MHPASFSDATHKDAAKLFDICRSCPTARSQSDEHPAFALRAMLLLVWMTLFVLAVLDQMGIGIDMRHAGEPAPVAKSMAAPPTAEVQRASSVPRLIWHRLRPRYSNASTEAVSEFMPPPTQVRPRMARRLPLR